MPDTQSRLGGIACRLGRLVGRLLVATLGGAVIPITLQGQPELAEVLLLPLLVGVPATVVYYALGRLAGESRWRWAALTPAAAVAVVLPLIVLGMSDGLTWWRWGVVWFIGYCISQTAAFGLPALVSLAVFDRAVEHVRRRGRPPEGREWSTPSTITNDHSQNYDVDDADSKLEWRPN